MADADLAETQAYVVVLSGTHVTGKETLAVHLAKHLGCPWIKAEMVHNAAGISAESQSKRGYNYGDVFGRIWFSKMRRLGFLSEGYESEGESSDTSDTAPRRTGKDCTAVITMYAMRRPARDALRAALAKHRTRPIIVRMNITSETLAGRTLGAEEPGLASHIMAVKVADLEKPDLVEETDVIELDSTKDVDKIFEEIKDGIREKIADLE